MCNCEETGKESYTERREREGQMNNLKPCVSSFKIVPKTPLYMKYFHI